MSKTIIIKDLDFSDVALRKSVIWKHIDAPRINSYWCGNFSTGALTHARNGAEWNMYWTSDPINIERFEYLYCNMKLGDLKLQLSVHMFYSELPTELTALSLYLGMEYGLSVPALTQNTPITIPENAKYVVVMDYSVSDGLIGGVDLYVS